MNGAASAVAPRTERERLDDFGAGVLIRASAAVLFVSSCAAKAPDIDDAAVSTGAACIVGGGLEDHLLSLSPAEAAAIVRLDLTATAAGHTAFATCTGVAVAPGWVLTALHCIPDVDHTTAVVTFGAAGVCDALTAKRFFAHDERDLCLVELPVDVATDFVPIAYGDDSELAPGQLVELSGFGSTDDGDSRRQFAVETVFAIDQTWISVSGAGRSGACHGDSGGPLLIRDVSGKVQVLGILSQGSADCVGTDSYVRLSSVRGWLDDRTAL
jgi:hypothetical protein